MLSNYKILTLTHHNIDAERVQEFAFDLNSDQGLECLKVFMDDAQVQEISVLSTCNRVQYLLYSENNSNAILDKLLNKLDFKLDRHLIDVYEGIKAVRHLFEVGASMNSLVIGEREIFRQMKESYEVSHKLGLTGDRLRILHKAMVKASKRIYTESKIGQKSVSIVSLAMQKFQELNFSKEEGIVLLGAGNTINLVSKFLKGFGYSNVTVYNRSEPRALKLSKDYGWTYKNLSDLKHHNSKFSTIISCTSSSQLLVTKDIFESLKPFHSDQMALIDLAVPQDIDESLNVNDHITYIKISDLKDLADANHQFRINELRSAEGILEEEIQEFEELFHRRFIERAFSSIPMQVNLVKEKALNEVFKKELENQSPETIALIEEMMDYLAKKCVAIPMKTAKEQYTNLKKGISSPDHHKVNHKHY